MKNLLTAVFARLDIFLYSTLQVENYFEGSVKHMMLLRINRHSQGCKGMKNYCAYACVCLFGL